MSKIDRFPSKLLNYEICSFLVQNFLISFKSLEKQGLFFFKCAQNVAYCFKRFLKANKPFLYPALITMKNVLLSVQTLTTVLLVFFNQFGVVSFNRHRTKTFFTAKKSVIFASHFFSAF